MVSSKKGKEREVVTEFTKIRESYNFTMTEVADELGIRLPAYGNKEKCRRNMRQATRERFRKELISACERIKYRREKYSEDLTLNSYVKKHEFNTVEEEIEDECKLELHYPIIDKKSYKRMLKQIIAGKTVVQVAVREGVDEEELKKLLDVDGVKYTFDTSYENLLGK